MNKHKLQAFLQGYIQCFREYDLNALKTYYQLPCTLSTPEKLVLVTTDTEFEQEFSQIFTQLQEANTTALSFTDVSYTKITDAVATLGGQWRFICDQKTVFAEFFACYQLIEQNNKITIVNVMSHEIDNRVTFSHALALTPEQE